MQPKVFSAMKRNPVLGQLVDVFQNTNNLAIVSRQTRLVAAHAEAVIIMEPSFSLVRNKVTVRGLLLKQHVNEDMKSNLMETARRVYSHVRHPIPIVIEGRDANQCGFKYALICDGRVFGIEKELTIEEV